MKALIALVLMITTFSAQAAENFPLNTRQACELVIQELYVDGAAKGWKRFDQGDRSYFVKDGYVGYFSQYDHQNGRCVLTSETVQEFQDRNQPKSQPVSHAAAREDEGFCSSTFCKVAVGVGVIALTIYGIKALGVANPNPCVLASDRARDGSLCGGRASSVRPGGR